MNNFKNGITTHILDTARGVPAANVTVRLEQCEDEVWQMLSEKITDDDGRAQLLDFMPTAGIYRLTFEVGSYFQKQKITSFYPRIEIIFSISEKNHHHIPLLLSPFGYNTYRGS